MLGALAGGDLPAGRLRLLANHAERVVAADGAADLLLAEGVTPDVVIGDLDSLSWVAREKLSDIRHVADQETTDADKLLAFLREEGYGRPVITGLEGDLPDHVLAGLQSCARSGLEVWLALRRGFGVVAGPGSLVLSADVGSRVSLIPLVPCAGVSLEGCRWPLTSETLDPMGRSGISNRALGGRVITRWESGVLFLFIEAEEPIPALLSSYGGL